jgi:hypothetical protein
MLNNMQLDARIAAANGLATGGIIAASVGGAALAGGLLWYVLAPRRSAEASREAQPTASLLLPTIASTGVQVNVGGTW